MDEIVPLGVRGVCTLCESSLPARYIVGGVCVICRETVKSKSARATYKLCRRQYENPYPSVGRHHFDINALDLKDGRRVAGLYCTICGKLGYELRVIAPYTRR